MHDMAFYYANKVTDCSYEKTIVYRELLQSDYFIREGSKSTSSSLQALVWV